MKEWIDKEFEPERVKREISKQSFVTTTKIPKERWWYIQYDKPSFSATYLVDPIDKPFVGEVSIFADKVAFYTKENGEIIVLVKEKSENVTITVKDNGIGITEEQKKNIFKPFFRTSEVRFIPGIGIGLSLVKQIAQMYDLDLSIESKENNGTTISIDKIKSS